MNCPDCGYTCHVFDSVNEPKFPELWGSAVCDECGYTLDDVTTDDEPDGMRFIELLHETGHVLP